VQAPPDVVRAELDVLRDVGIDTFVDLTEGSEYGLRPYAPYLAPDVEYRHHAIRDFGCPTPQAMGDILDTIDDALARGRNVYVHCYAGIGRTGTVVSCFLVRRGMDAREAMRTVTGWRGVRTPQSDEQLEFVLAWRA
jgi:protein tyrosine phosphatase